MEGMTGLRSGLLRAVGRRVLCVAAAGLLLMPHVVRGQAIGVMPMYDASNEDIGPQFTEQSTLMLYQELTARGAKVVLLNPGGVYLTSDLDLIGGYASQSRASSVLVTSLQQVERPPRGKKGDWFLVVQASLFQSGTGVARDLGMFRVKVKAEELTVEMSHGHFWGTTGSRPFSKQPLGHVAEKIVGQVVTAAMSNGGAMPYPGANVGTSIAGGCAGTFRVSFPKGGRVSKSYDLLLDGADESVKIEDGIAPISVGPGEHLLLLHVADPPYKVPVQHQYAFNVMQDCSRPNLVAELDPGGGMVLKQQ